LVAGGAGIALLVMSELIRFVTSVSVMVAGAGMSISCFVCIPGPTP
jgi:hypothetical protein